MAKWCGKVGFAETVESETRPGKWVENIVERTYYGDTIRNTRLLQNSGEVNDNINLANQISILADPYAMNHFSTMRYVEFMNTQWKISNVEVQYPRLILMIGGLYNGPKS